MVTKQKQQVLYISKSVYRIYVSPFRENPFGYLFITYSCAKTQDESRSSQILIDLKSFESREVPLITHGWFQSYESGVAKWVMADHYKHNKMSAHDWGSF